MRIKSDMTLEQVAIIVCTALDKVGIQAVLTGGSAATFYAPESYQSCDIDFVIEFSSKNSGGAAVLAELGFVQKGSTYVCSETIYTLDFPAGPLAIGDEFITNWSTEISEQKILRIISPTDSVRDRLCSFYFWNDYKALEAAVGVATAKALEVNLELIRTWSQKEYSLDKYEVFLRRIERA